MLVNGAPGVDVRNIEQQNPTVTTRIYIHLHTTEHDMTIDVSEWQTSVKYQVRGLLAW